MNLREDDRVSAVALVVESGGAAGTEPADGGGADDDAPAPTALEAG
jgi:hypothetical protein